MRGFRIVMPALLACLMIAATAATAMGQGVATPAAETPPLSELEGIDKAYGRSFMADMASLANTENAEEGPSGWFMLTATVLAFDSEEHAGAARDVLFGEPGEAAAGDLELQDVDLDLDVDYSAQRANQEEQGISTSIIQVVAQDEANLYVVVGVTFGDDPTEVAEAVTRTMVTTDVSEDDEAFNPTGISTGGLWAKLPDANAVAEMAAHLTNVTDVVIYPVAAATPEASPAA